MGVLSILYGVAEGSVLLGVGRYIIGFIPLFQDKVLLNLPLDSSPLKVKAPLPFEPSVTTNPNLRVTVHIIYGKLFFFPLVIYLKPNGQIHAFIYVVLSESSIAPETSFCHNLLLILLC